MNTDITANTTVTLANGNAIPLFGLGTWLAHDELCYEAVKIVLQQHGIKLIDTAALYKNEDQVGKAIKETKISREELFLVTKLESCDHGNEQTKNALKESLKRLQVDYVDLYLVHTPKGGNVVETWKAMLELKQLGLTKSVGVSNFGVEQLKQLIATGLEPPEVNQIELHPFLPQTECVEFCKENNITVMGYCPLARLKCTGNETLVDIGKKYNKTETQVMIRWAVQKGIITIPKSTNPKHIASNCDIFNFQLTDEDMEAIRKIENGFKASTSVNNQDIPWDEVK